MDLKNPSQFDPIHYVADQEDNEWEGRVLPGWYFWDETWAGRSGPYLTRELAEQHLKVYCDQL